METDRQLNEHLHDLPPGTILRKRMSKTIGLIICTYNDDGHLYATVLTHEEVVTERLKNTFRFNDRWIKVRMKR